MVEVFFYHLADVLGDPIREIVVFVKFEGQLPGFRQKVPWLCGVKVLDSTRYSSP